MKTIRSVAAAFAVTVCFCAFSTQAEESVTAMAPSPGITSGSESSLMGNVRGRLYSDFATTYHGPALNKFGPYSLNAVGEVDPGALSGFDSELHGAFIIDKGRQIAVGPDIWFFYQPNVEGGNQFQLQDSGIKAFYKNTVVTDKFRLYTSAYIQLPTSDYAREHHMAFALRTTPWVMYDIGQTRWRVGSWSDFRYLAGVASDMDVKAYVQPYISYRLTDKVALNLAYETEAHHEVGQPFFKYHNILSDFQPGAIWQVTPRLKLTGYILVFPSQRLATDTTGVGATLYSQLL